MKEHLSLVSQLLNATQEDIDEIDEQITVVTKEILEKKALRVSLNAIRKVMHQKLNGKEPKKPRVKREKSVGTPGRRSFDDASDLAKDVYQLLDREGSVPLPVIAEKLSIRPAAVGACISASPLFRRENGEVHLA